MKTITDPKNRFVIIMAGGRGERFWPLSREHTPKQLLALLGNFFCREPLSAMANLSNRWPTR